MASSPWDQHPIFSRDQCPCVRKTYSSNINIYIYVYLLMVNIWLIMVNNGIWIYKWLMGFFHGISMVDIWLIMVNIWLMMVNNNLVCGFNHLEKYESQL